MCRCTSKTSGSFAFHHTNPLWENHVVLLPRKHIESLLTLEEADNDLLLELMRTAKIIAGDFMARFGACRVYTNLGITSLQASPLAHRLRQPVAAVLIFEVHWLSIVCGLSGMGKKGATTSDGPSRNHLSRRHSTVGP